MRWENKWVRLFAYFGFFGLIFYRYWDHSIIYRDSFIFFGPNKFLIGEALKAGRFFLWNPWVQLGMPLAGESQAGLFYPLNFLFAVFSFGAAHRIFILAHYPLAAFFMDLFLRGRRLSPRAAAFGALAFSLSGYLISQHSLVRMTLGGAWIPLSLYCFDRAARDRFFVAAAGASLALMILAGDPETALFVAAWGATILGLRTWRDRNPAPAINLALAGAATLTLSALQVLPAWEMIALTERAQGVTDAQIFSLHPGQLLEFLWSTPYGTNWPDYNYWGQFLLGFDAEIVNLPWSTTNYLGLSVLFLAGLGFVAPGPRWRLTILAATVFFLLLALGSYTPVYALLHDHVPLFKSMRYPSKFVIFVSFGLAAAAALGVDEAAKALELAPRRATIYAVSYLAAAVVIAAVMAGLWPRVMAWKAPFAPDSEFFRQGLEYFWTGWKQWIAFNLALGAVGLLTARRALSWRRGLAIAFAVVLADWWIATILPMPAGPAEIYRFQPIAEQVLRRDDSPAPGKYRIFSGELTFIRDRNPATRGLPAITQKAIWSRNILRPNLFILSRIESVDSYDSYDFVIDRQLLDGDVALPLLEMFNVRYYLDQKDRPIPGAPTIYVDPPNGIRINRLDRTWPRAWFTDRPLFASDPDQARKLLPLAWQRRTAVILETGPASGDTGTTEGAGDTAGLIPAAVTRYEPDRVTVEVDAPTAGWLVLSDRWFPGWRAEVDGRETPIRRANLLVRAVPVGPGFHRVDFVYRPRSVLVGCLISVPAWFLFFGAWGAWARRNRSA